MISSAETIDQKKKALALVKKIYQEQGYIGKDGGPSPFEKYILLDQTKVFTVYENGIITGTVSVVLDHSQIGLPIDILYNEELNALRKEGRKIAEVTQLAGLHFLPLFQAVLQYVKYKSIDILAITINPKHDSFYKLLGFKELGGLKYYPSLNNAPALARILDLKVFFNQKNLPHIFNEMINAPVDLSLMG